MEIEKDYIAYLNELINGDSKSLIGVSLKHNDFSEFPLMTHKKMFTKGVLAELLFFLKGQHDNEVLLSQGVNIWTQNASQEFKSKNNIHLPDNELGPIYGYQWRNFNNENIDQLKIIANELKNKSVSRQLLMSAWCPTMILKYNKNAEFPMVLPPCHVSYQFLYRNNKLHLVMYQRSGDICLGVPFNIASCGFMLLLMSKYTGIEPGTLTINFGDLHIYPEHIEIAKEINNRGVYNGCKVKCNATVYDDFDEFINNLKISDFEITEYKCNETIKFPLICN